jgi:Trk-type K+ transport system membrane component
VNDSNRNLLFRIREWVNLRIYSTKNVVIKGLRYISVPLSILAFGSLIYSYGFSLSSDKLLAINYLLKATIGFYIIKFLVEGFYSFSPIQYIKNSKWETFLMSYMIINIFLINVFDIEIISSIGKSLGLMQLDEFLMIFIQGYFLIFVALEMGKASRLLPYLKLSPPALLVSSFIIITSLGSLFLLMPEMTKSGISMSIYEAAFTSVSAVSVTGLNIINVADFLSFKGKVVIMILIQLGGLNFIAFASIFALLANSAIGTRYKSLIQVEYSSDSLASSALLIRQIFKFSVIFEVAATILLFFSWGDYEFQKLGDKIFFSVFHAISAFNNAGFTLFPEGLSHPLLSQNIPFLLIMSITIILGGLGFGAIHDLFSYRAFIMRRRNPWKHLKVNSKIALYSTIALIIFGSVFYALLEDEYILEGFKIVKQSFFAFTQIAIGRTAGFNIVEVANLTLPTLLILIFLMFIGGASGSTAGGIKTSTFTLVLLNALATIRGRKRVEVFKHTIPMEMLNLALSVFLFTLGGVLLGIFLLSITDGHLGLIRLAFEQVSAFCTVGLSMGITSDLSEVGKIILMISMLIGRIGTVTLAFALTRRKKESHDYTYPKAQVQVG